MSKVVCEVSCWRFLAGQARAGRPAEVDSDPIKTLTGNNQCDTTQERANMLKVPNSIKLLVKMRNVFFFNGKNHMDFLANPIFNITEVCIYRLLDLGQVTEFLRLCKAGIITVPTSRGCCQS